MAGVAVVATRQVGASICLGQPWRGEVVRSLSPPAVAKAIQRLAELGMLDAASRARRSRWARERLSAKAGAQYLLAILAHRYDGAPRPPAFYTDAWPPSA